MISILAGYGLFVAGLGFLTRYAIGREQAHRWPPVCMGTRAVLLITGAACAVRGLQLIRGTQVSADSLLLAAVVCLYSATMTAAALKQRRDDGAMTPPMW